MVYIKEAHAMDSMMPSSFGGVEDPVTDEERQEVCVRFIDDLGIPIPAIVDDMEDSVNRAYGAWPDRLYLIGKSGQVAYAGAPGPSGFNPNDLEAAIEEELAGPRSTLLAALDADGDGKLSAAEIAGAAEALKKLDKDGDGQLSPEELGEAPKPAPAPPADTPRGQGGRGMVDRFDTNGDGKLTREEFPERMRPQFERMDTNDDGVIDAEEMRAMASRRRRR
jgi:hypothetical protein